MAELLLKAEPGSLWWLLSYWGPPFCIVEVCANGKYSKIIHACESEQAQYLVGAVYPNSWLSSMFKVKPVTELEKVLYI